MKKYLFLGIAAAFSLVCKGQGGYAKVKDVFNFSIGDTFQYRLNGCFFNCNGQNAYSNDYQLIILDRFYSLSHDSLCYIISGNWLNYHDTIVISNLDSPVLMAPYIHSFFYPRSIRGITRNAGCFERDTIYDDTTCNFRHHTMAYGGCIGFGIDQRADYVDSVGVFYMQDTNGEGGYNDPSQNWKLELLYYSKGSEKWGAPLDIPSFIPEQLHKNIANIYPNPTYGELTFDMGFAQGGTILTIVNSLGQVMLTKIIAEDNHSIKMNVSQLAAGIFYVRIFKEGGPVNTAKFVKY
jgi:hypothetical protein